MENVKRHFSLLLASVLFVPFSISCATLPPREVHTAVGLPRLQNITLLNVPQEKVTLGIDSNYSIALTDSGYQKGSAILGGHLELTPHDSLSLGAMPYRATVLDSLDSAGHWGLELYLKWRALKKSDWDITLYPSLRYAKNAASDRGFFCFLVFCAPTANASYASIEITDPGLGASVGYHPSDSQTLSLFLSGYWTQITSTNVFNNQTQYDRKNAYWNGSALLGYLIKPGKVGVQLGGGIASNHGIGERSVSKGQAIGQLSLIFSE